MYLLISLLSLKLLVVICTHVLPDLSANENITHLHIHHLRTNQSVQCDTHGALIRKEAVCRLIEASKPARIFHASVTCERVSYSTHRCPVWWNLRLLQFGILFNAFMS